MAGTVLITGASSGIGAATARRLTVAGYQVFGTSRKCPTSGEGQSGIPSITMDVCIEASVKAAVEAVIQRAGGIDAPAFESTTKVYPCFNDYEACLLVDDKKYAVCNEEKGYMKGSALCGVCIEMTHVRMEQKCVACDMTDSAKIKGIAAASTFGGIFVCVILYHVVKHQLAKMKKRQVIGWLVATFVCGFAFIFLEVNEFVHLYLEVMIKPIL